MMNIELISEELMKPSHPTPSHLRYLKPSLFDQVNIPILMPLIFFFSNKQTPTPSTILTRLKNSLSATLSIFYPLAGRVQFDSSHITCNDEGVPYLQAHLPYTSLSQVVHNADVSLLDKLLPSSDDTQGYTKLVLVIQVNTFACGGIAIGIKINHVVSDGFSFAMFVKTWAEMASGGAEPPYLRPRFEIWREFPPHGPIVSGELDPDLLGSKPVTKWFMFSKPMCDALKARLYLDGKNNQPSVTMAISAFIYSRIKLLRTSGVNNIPNEVYHAVNIRPKVIIPPGCDYYFGNMVVNAIVNPNDNHLEATRESIKEIIGKSRLIDNMRNGKEDLRFMMDHFERESRGEITSLGFSSFRGLPVYEADFGWGKPVWVTSATLVFKDMVLIIAGDPSRQDTYVYVNLSPDEMSRLEADPEFNSFVSKSATFVNTSKL
ncbi:stemmadenine O-acetyltransferase-like [Silene latifolia]|uniref:stemmadenine O-acetyltransferase-like n=1 Tax=Silene latifolia TaxID=37657 RepID=UPI003D77C329